MLTLKQTRSRRYQIFNDGFAIGSFNQFEDSQWSFKTNIGITTEQFDELKHLLTLLNENPSTLVAKLNFIEEMKKTGWNLNLSNLEDWDLTYFLTVCEANDITFLHKP